MYAIHSSLQYMYALVMEVHAHKYIYRFVSLFFVCISCFVCFLMFGCASVLAHPICYFLILILYSSSFCPYENCHAFFTFQNHRGETWCANVHVRASKMEDRRRGAQTRSHFSHLTLIFRLEIDVQESSCLEAIHVISNLTGSVLYCCWAACEIWRKMRERTWLWYDALTYINAWKQRMRERTLRRANERFLVPTNGHGLLASRSYHL